MTRAIAACACALAIVAAAGCSKRTMQIAECDQLLDMVQKLGSCRALSTEDRTKLDASTRVIKDSLAQFRENGGANTAPPDLVASMRDICKTQNRVIVDDYSKLVPDCLK